jgi:hypothetical protein
MALFQPRQPTVHMPIFGPDGDGRHRRQRQSSQPRAALAASVVLRGRASPTAGGLVVMASAAAISARELGDAVTSDHDTSPELVARGPNQDDKHEP